MFMGTYKHNVDAKGRLTLPAVYRKEFEDTVVVCKGFDGCLNVYSNPEWERFYEQLTTIQATKKNGRAFIRMVLSKAATVEIDKMGRILIPQNLRDEIGLVKEAVITGFIGHIEIWDETVWNNYNNEHSTTYEDLSEELEF